MKRLKFVLLGLGVSGLFILTIALAPLNNAVSQAVDNTGLGAQTCVGPNCVNNGNWPPIKGPGVGGGPSSYFVMDQDGHILQSNLDGQVTVARPDQPAGNGWFVDTGPNPKWGEGFIVAFDGGPYSACSSQLSNVHYGVATFTEPTIANGQNAALAGGSVEVVVNGGGDGPWPYQSNPQADVLVTCVTGNWATVTQPVKAPICKPTPFHPCP